MRLDFFKADLDAGYALARQADQVWKTGDREHARQAIAEARRLYRNAWRLFLDLQPSEVEEFAPRLDQLERFIEQTEQVMRDPGSLVRLVFN